MEINRKNLHERSIRSLRRAKPWQPDILLVQGNSGLMVVKDYRYRSFLYRVAIGLISVWNEARMYRRLQGLTGIPKYFGHLDRYAFAIEYIPGQMASQLRKGEIPADFFRKLEGIISAVHARGIVLCDMRNKKNVIVTETFDPYIIDLCTAFHSGSRWNFPRRFLFRIFYQDDLMGIAKLKSLLFPQLLSSDEERKLQEGLLFQKEAMAVRNFCVRWLKKLVSDKKNSN